jgi:hypothetical protein
VVSLFVCEGMCSARQGRVKKRIEVKKEEKRRIQEGTVLKDEVS